MTAVAPDLVAFTLGDSDSYKALTPTHTPALGGTKRPQLFPSGDVSGPSPAAENRPGLRGVGPCPGVGGSQGGHEFSLGGGV